MKQDWHVNSSRRTGMTMIWSSSSTGSSPGISNVSVSSSLRSSGRGGLSGDQRLEGLNGVPVSGVDARGVKIKGQGIFHSRGSVPADISCAHTGVATAFFRAPPYGEIILKEHPLTVKPEALAGTSIVNCGAMRM